MLASSIRAASAYFELYVKDVLFKKGIADAKKGLLSLDKTAKSIFKADMLRGAINAVRGFATEIARMGMDAEQALANVRAAGGLTDEQFQRMRNSVMQTSRDLGQGMTVITEAFGELIKAGVPLETVLNGAGKAAAMFAKVGGLDAKEAGVALADAMKVFGETADNAANILSAAADASSTDIHEMVMAFRQSATEAQAAGMSLGDLATAIAILAVNGKKGQDAGTSLKRMMQLLKAPSNQGAEAMAEMGLSVRDANLEMLPFVEILSRLNAAMAGMDAAKRASTMMDIFGSDAASAAQILASAGAGGFGDMQSQMAQSLTVGQKFSEVTNTASGAWDRILAAVGRLAHEVMLDMGKGFGGFIDQLIRMLDILTEMASGPDGFEFMFMVAGGILETFTEVVNIVLEWAQVAKEQLVPVFEYIYDVVKKMFATIKLGLLAMRYAGAWLSDDQETMKKLQGAIDKQLQTAGFIPTKQGSDQGRQTVGLPAIAGRSLKKDPNAYTKDTGAAAPAAAMGSFGTFNAFAAQRFASGGGTPIGRLVDLAQKQLDAVGQGNELLRRIARRPNLLGVI